MHHRIGNNAEWAWQCSKEDYDDGEGGGECGNEGDDEGDVVVMMEKVYAVVIKMKVKVMMVWLKVMW